MLCLGCKNNLRNILFRSSRPELFCKKGVLRNFTRFTGQRLCQSLYFNNVASLRLATLLKKRLWYRCFPVNLVKFLRTPFYIEHLWTAASAFFRKLTSTKTGSYGSISIEISFEDIFFRLYNSIPHALAFLSSR